MTTALVTGASGGIGAAISRVLAARGLTVALHYQSGRDAAEATRRSLEGNGHILVQADLADPKAIERLWNEAAAAGRIDVVVNNAGIFPNHPPLTIQDWVAEDTRHQPARAGAPLALCCPNDGRAGWGEDREHLFPWCFSWRAQGACIRGE
jgi:NAD(P)-dependent dehydrogenase (short-subunit alcohol dehydrogenase family)